LINDVFTKFPGLIWAAVLANMGAMWWGRGGHVPPTFFFLGFVFGEVSKIKVMFVTFCVKSFSC